MELLERHFDIALKSPDGIKKLRELILSLAMQGKLVPQDASDQPASELLKEIEAEKKKLIKEGKIKKQEPLPPIKPEEMPYEVPTGWEWVRLGEVANKITDGTHHSPPNTEVGEYKYITAKNIKNDGINLSSVTFVTEEIHRDIYSRCNPQKGDILYIKDGATTGIVTINELEEEFSMLSSVALIKLPKKLLQTFLVSVMRSPLIYKGIRNDMSGVAITRVTLTKINDVIVPLPPLAEQKRIVAKIDQLMALCDKLEVERDARNKKRVTLHAAAMDRLLSAPDEAAFSASWEFITRNFSDLYSVPENVAELKKAILQLAVMGKLVPQDPKDQPASELLKEIEAEKKRLIKEGKVKKQEPLPPIKPEEIPYAVPTGWEWVRLGEVCKHITDGEHQTPPRIPEGRCLLSAKNIRDGFIDYSNHDCISDEDYFKSRKRCCPEYGDLLIVSVGGTIGRNSLVIEDDEFALVRSVALIKSIIINTQYLRHTMNSVLLQGMINEKKRGGAQPCLYLSEISKFIFPIPPLAEQKRIVAKVDQLMELCNSLEQQLQDSTRKQTAILGAVLATM